MSNKKEKFADLPIGAQAVVVLILVVSVAAVLAVGAASTLLLWNYALVPIVAACGGTISKIGFWLALGFNILWGCTVHPLIARRKSA